MTELVSYDLKDGVATIAISNGKANALSHEVFEGLNAALDRAEQDKAVVILTGQPGAFSAGCDREGLQKGPNRAAQLVKTGSSFTRRVCACPLASAGSR